MRESLYFAAGLAMGSANTVRHRLAGYRHPRPFDASDPLRSAQYAFKVVDRWQERGGMDPQGRRVLEIGPGPDLATGAVLLQRGAVSYAAVDVNPLLIEDPTPIYDEVSRLGGAGWDRERVTYSVDSFPDLQRVTGEFDLIVSNATLEHVDDVPGLFRRLTDSAAPGCAMCHHVDAKTHMRWIKDRDPLNILRYPQPLYERLLSFPGAPNRLRASDYVKAAQEAGWTAKVVAGNTADPGYLARTRPRLARPWRARPPEDLSLLSFTLRADLRAA
jgi:hypothetical protein